MKEDEAGLGKSYESANSNTRSDRGDRTRAHISHGAAASGEGAENESDGVERCLRFSISFMLSIELELELGR